MSGGQARVDIRPQVVRRHRAGHDYVVRRLLGVFMGASGPKQPVPKCFLVRRLLGGRTSCAG
eukprot:16230743-Heterocapsa_arctica.AAC.1